MTEPRSIRSNIRDLATASFAFKPLWFLFLLFSTRLLGAEEFGRTMLAISFVSIIAVCLEGGVDILIVREVSTHPDQFSRMFSHSLLFKTLSGIAAGLIAWALSFVSGIGAPPGDLLLAAIVYSFFNTILLHVRAVFRAFEIMNLEALSIVQEKALVIALCGAALAIRRDAGVFLAGMAAAYALAAAWALLRLRRFRRWQKLSSSSREIWGDVVRPALPFALMNLFAVIYFRSGTLMLKALTESDALVGYYNAGYRLIESYMFLPALISVPIYPVLVRSIAERRDVSSLVGKAARGVLLMTTVIVLPLFIFRSFFTRLFFGEEFSPAQEVVGLIALAMIPVGMNFVYGSLVAASGRQSRANAYIVAVTALNLALNFALIPRWNVNGAAITTLVTELLLMTANMWVTRDLVRTGSEPARA